MPQTKIKTIVLLSDDSLHIAAIKNTFREIDPLLCFIEASDSIAAFDFVNDASRVAFTPNLIILDMDLSMFAGKNLLHLLYDAFNSPCCSILLLAQENDPRCRLYSMLYGFNLLHKPACTHDYRQTLSTFLPVAMHTQL